MNPEDSMKSVALSLQAFFLSLGLTFLLASATLAISRF